MDALKIKKTFDRLNAKLVRQGRECDAVDSWLRPELEAGFEVPRKATREHRALRDLSRTPWLKLVVDNVVQAMYVDSTVGDEGRIEELWALWNANGMRSQQISNHRAMVAYGHSYAVVTGANHYGEQSSKIRFLSPRRVAVEFDDLGADPYPSAALELESKGGDVSRYRLRVPGREYVLEQGEKTGQDMDGLVITGDKPSGLAHVPVVRFANQLDLDGRVIGEVEPFIPSARRINKTAYDRMLAQHFNSWKVKTATGLDMPEQLDEDGDGTGRVDEAAAEELKLKLDQADILTGSRDVKFGTLDATALDPFVNGWRADIEALAAASQTPAHALTGMIVNLSADALAAARGPLTQKVYERQQNASAAYANVMRVAAQIAGHEELAQDDMIRVTWQDMEVRSMAQAVDALGKAAQMLRIPARGLWGMIPTVEASDVQEWERMSEEELERDPLAASFNRQAESTISSVTGVG